MIIQNLMIKLSDLLDDHNCPKFDDLEPFCEALDEWLCADPEVSSMYIYFLCEYAYQNII